MEIILVAGSFAVLYYIAGLFLKINPKTTQRIGAMAANPKWYRLFILLSAGALVIFADAFGLWYIGAESDMDNSGMGLVLFVSPVVNSIILLLASVIGWLVVFRMKMRMNNTLFLIMLLLTVPSALLILTSILWVVLLLVNCNCHCESREWSIYISFPFFFMQRTCTFGIFNYDMNIYLSNFDLNCVDIT